MMAKSYYFTAQAQILSSTDQVVIKQNKGKLHPITDREGPRGRGEWKYSSTLSLTSALDVGGWSRPRPGRFTPGKDAVPNG
jgi:hypothetical protein